MSKQFFQTPKQGHQVRCSALGFETSNLDSKHTIYFSLLLLPFQMDRAAEDLFLRAHAFLSSQRTRVENAFRALLNRYSPETWLVLYYPLFYFAKIAKRCPQWTAEQGQGILSDWSFSSGDQQASLHVSSLTVEKIALSLVILVPLCYVFSLQYHLLDSRSWRTTSPAEESSKSGEDSLYDATDRAPERLLQTNVDTGLTEDQVSKRQNRYDPNEILVTRNWFYVLLRLALGTTNLVLEVSLVGIPEIADR